MGCVDYGNITISPQLIYEDENSYFPHDHFINFELGELLDKSVELNKLNNGYELINTYNDGYSGHEIKINYNSNLKITNVDFKEWSDMVDGSETKYTVEDIIFSTNQIPNESKNLIGHYTLNIKEDYKAGKFLRKEGVKDKTTYRTFNGKFKFYNKAEIQHGLNWVKEQNEIRLGIKDSLGIYSMPDEFAKFGKGDIKLKEILSRYSVERSETDFESKIFILVNLVIDENGMINKEDVRILDKMKSNRIVDLIRNDKELMNNWIPAKRNGENVKSEINLTIQVQE
jgi:hypothetical protein